MDCRVVLKSNKEKVFTDEIHIDLVTNDFTEKTHKFRFEVIEGDEKEISLGGMKIFFGSLDIGDEVALDIKYNIPFLIVNFELEGGLTYQPKNEPSKSLPYSMSSNEYNLVYMPELDGTISYTCNKRTYFSLFFTEEYIKNIFQKNFSKVSYDFGKALKQNTPFLMFNKSQPIPYDLVSIINDIKNCCYVREIKEAYVKSKITELVSVLFTKLQGTQTHTTLNNRDLESVKQTESILRTQFTQMVTLDDLVKQVGSNKFKLKKQFKMVYGQSIFEYQSRLRMDKAKDMLEQNDFTISEVAYAVGYKNPQHFTVAFKKRFHCLPSDLKKQLQ